MLFTIPLNMFLLPGSDCNEDEGVSESMWKLFRIQPIIIIALVIVIVSNTWGFLDPTLSTHLSEVTCILLLYLFRFFRTYFDFYSSIYQRSSSDSSFCSARPCMVFQGRGRNLY